MPHVPVILLVDDSAAQLKATSKVVSAMGCEVVTADNGLAALPLLEKHQPDVIVTDLHMPRMDGANLTKLIRARSRFENTPILVCTSDTSRQLRIELLKQGADDFILKPVDLDELRERLRVLVKRGQTESELEQTRDERDQLIEQLRHQHEELTRLTLGLVSALEKANAYNDSDTGMHIRRVCRFSRLLAEAAGCNEDLCDAIERFAGIHDVGKVGIPDSILKKPGKLTREEFEEMKQHTVIGHQLARSAGLPDLACNIPLGHHERWDGGGYPNNIVGKDIPLEARIVTVADVFDALTTRRPYKEPFPYQKARSMMEELAGKQFDPRLIDLFFEMENRIIEVQREFSDRRPDSILEMPAVRTD